MAASDNLGGQFDREATRRTIPQHHHDAIRNAISRLGEHGIELVPGGLHVTPNDGGKPHFIPHVTGSSELTITHRHGRSDVELHARVPTEAQGTYHETNLVAYPESDVITSSSRISLPWFPDTGGLRTTHRDSLDDPAHFMNREHDAVLPHSSNYSDSYDNRYVESLNDAHETRYYKSSGLTAPSSVLPHLGGNIKDPAHSIRMGNYYDDIEGFSSEQLSGMKGVHRAWSHVYDPEMIESTISARNPRLFPRPAFEKPLVNVDIHEPDDGGKSTFYDYDTTTGQIRPR